jgi:SSS family solute:Na+ symporter
LSLDLAQPTILVMMCYGLVQYGDNYTTAQTCAQRYLAVSTTRQAQRSIWIGNLSCVAAWTFFMFLGTLLYAYYRLHPGLLPAAIAAQQTEVLPYFVVTHLPPGAVGLFLAVLGAAGVSSLDATMNALSLTTLEDFVLRRCPNLSNRTQMILARLVSCFWGLVGVTLALSMIRVQAALDFSFMMFSILAGGVFGMFLLGLFTRRAHALGVYVGLLAGITVTLWASAGQLSDAGLPLPSWLEKGRFPVHVLLTSACANGTSFVVGYVASLVLPRLGPKDTAGLTLWQLRGSQDA